MDILILLYVLLEISGAIDNTSFSNDSQKWDRITEYVKDLVSEGEG